MTAAVTRRAYPSTARQRSLALVALVALAACGSGETPAGSIELDTARFAPGAPSGPPPPGATDWTTVTLPDLRSPSGREPRTTGWYRMDVSLDATSTPTLALYLSSVSMNAEAFLNGVWIGSGGPFSPRIANNWNRPLYFPFSSALLRRGPNEVLIRVDRLGHAQGWLGPVRIGSADVLSPMYERQFFRQITAPRLASALGVVVTALLLGLWVASRDGVYAWFALTTVFWVVVNLNFHVRDLPIPVHAWEVVGAGALLGLAASFSVFALRSVGRRHPIGERVLLGATAIGVVLLASVGQASFYRLFEALAVPAFGVATGAWAMTLRHTWRSDRTIFVCYLASGLLGFACLGKDLVTHLGLLPPHSPALSAFAGPALVLGFGATLMARFVRAFSRASAQNDELEKRVREKEVALERHFERVRRLEEERLLAHERERIMREMHDGVGGHLVRTLALVEGQHASSGEIAAALRSSLDDMRMVIDSLDPVVDDLATLLGTIRGRLEPGLRRRGLRFVWRVADLPPVPRLGPEEFLHILRIVQEAVTNVLKHAKAQTITVTTGERTGPDERPGVFLEVRDDGIGLDPTRPRGRGLGNLTWRAERLRGSLEARAAGDAPGTVVRLWLPLG